MFRSRSPFGNDASSYAESIQSNGYPPADDTVSETSTVSRPTAKSIYLQRKEYAASINQRTDNLQYRVEHLFTFELDGRELRSIPECVEQLKLLEEMGRVWGQTMLLEVQGPKLMLRDIESKTDLETMALSDVLEIKAVLDSGVFSSLLTLSVQTRRNNITSVFMFQCDDVRADNIQRALKQAASHNSRTSAVNPGWMTPNWEENGVSDPELFGREEEGQPSLQGQPQTYTQQQKNIDDLNHILNDVEIFMGQMNAAVARNAKKKKKTKKGKYSMPTPAEFESCLHKIKCGFNLLAELNGKIHDPSAPDYVHIIFSILAVVESHSPVGLPASINVPLLTPQCVRLLSEEATPQEIQLWESLGEAWNTPSNEWAEDNEDTPTYNLGFRDRSQLPELSAEPVSRMERPQLIPQQKIAKWRPPHPLQKPGPDESKPRHVRVLYDFTSRNSRELTIRKGDILELLDTSKQWWKVRDSRGEEGYVPNNVLEHVDEQPELNGGSVVLTRRSKPTEVKAWLENKGFSKITVRCLDGLSGSMLLEMSREKLKIVCPEEGGHVFFQLQAVRSSLALSETTHGAAFSSRDELFY